MTSGYVLFAVNETHEKLLKDMFVVVVGAHTRAFISKSGQIISRVMERKQAA